MLSIDYINNDVKDIESKEEILKFLQNVTSFKTNKNFYTLQSAVRNRYGSNFYLSEESNLEDIAEGIYFQLSSQIVFEEYNFDF